MSEEGLSGEASASLGSGVRRDSRVFKGVKDFKGLKPLGHKLMLVIWDLTENRLEITMGKHTQWCKARIK
jgi:hypothetical protein